MKTHIVIFGTADYHNAIESLLTSARGYFDHYHVFSQKDIDIDFYNKHIKILSASRGAGYWLWKPYFIKKILTEAGDGDIVFYVDAGNIFLRDPSFLYDYASDIILFDNRDGMVDGSPAQNFISCKKDAFVLMDCDNSDCVNATHLNASYQVYKRSEVSLNFVSQYLSYCTVDQIITDEPNQHGNNYPGYYDHRHDQSVLSLLAYKNDITPLVDPSEWGNICVYRGFQQLFHHHRNKNYILR